MAGAVNKMLPLSPSMSGNEFVDFNADISIALEYTGSPVNHHVLPKVLPVDVDCIPTAKVAASPAIFPNLSLPVVEPIVRSNFKAATEVKLSSRVEDSKNPVTPLGCNFTDVYDDPVCSGEFVENANLKDGIESSGTLGFSDSTQDHSPDLSESSDMLETPIDCNEIEGFQNYEGPDNWNSIGPSSTSQGFLGGIFCNEEEASDDEHLECRRTKKGAVTFCDHESSEVVAQEDSVYSEEGVVRETPFPERPPKRGMCYLCHRGNRFTEKEACFVCDAKYCGHCIVRAMGSMPEGRKCLTCIGFPVVDESKRQMLGKGSRILRGLWKEEVVKQIMEAELSAAANQLPPERIFVNGRPLCLEELMELRSCPNPPRKLKPGSYWYDKVSGFWGKEGHQPCQLITPDLNVGNPKMKPKASNGNTKVFINGREITKKELLMLKSAGVLCAGTPNFWVQADGSYREEGMDAKKENLWGRRTTKLLCTLLSLPTPDYPNPRGQSKEATEGDVPNDLEQRTKCNMLLVGNDRSGTSTIYKQARVLYQTPFSEEERQNFKLMIQSNLYGYLGRLLEGREQFEEESMLEMRKSQSTDQPGPSGKDMTCEIQSKTNYTVSQKLKNFSDWLINVMVSGNLDIVFSAATREYAPFVEELWKDAAIQATYSRRDELELPRVASYFLDRAVEIAKMDYEPSDTDILYAEGITSANGLASMEFSFPKDEQDGFRDLPDLPGPFSRYQLLRVHTRSLGEKCKWLEMFEDFGIVLFCVALTDYDEYEVDSDGVVMNKMLQSKRLFESIVTHPTCKEMNFLLILNKFDLLEEKIEQVPLTCCEWFQDFNPVFSRHQSSRRGADSVAPRPQRAFHYIAVQFKRLFKSLTGRKLYVSPVTGLESDTVGSALRYARDIIRWEEDRISFSFNESSCDSIEIDNSSSS